MGLTLIALCALAQPSAAQNSTAISFGGPLVGTLEETLSVRETLAEMRLEADGDVEAVQCVGVLVEQGRPVRAWSSRPVAASRARGICTGATPLFLGEEFFPGDRFFPGDMFYPGDEITSPEVRFPGDMFFPGDMLFPGDMFRRYLEMRTERRTGVVLFVVPEEQEQRRNLMILPIIIALNGR